MDTNVTYKIVKITDREGKDKTDGRYPLRIGRTCNIIVAEIGLPMFLGYIEDADGIPFTQGESLHTSRLEALVHQPNGLIVATTKNSIYHLKNVSTGETM